MSHASLILSSSVAFGPFTFNVIIGMLGLKAAILIDFSWLCFEFLFTSPLCVLVEVNLTSMWSFHMNVVIQTGSGYSRYYDKCKQLITVYQYCHSNG